MLNFSPRLLVLCGALFLSSSPCEARLWKLWGGKATIDLPNGYVPKANGPYTYQIMAISPGVISIVISKVVGSAGRPDWAPIATAWKRSLAATKAKVIIAPKGSGNFFDVEFSQPPQNYTKKRIVNGPRTKDDFRNLYDVTLIAIPSSAASSKVGKALLKSVRSFQVKR